MGLRVRRFDYLWNNWGLRFIWDEGTSIGKEEDRPFLSGLMYTRILRGLSVIFHFNNEPL